MKEIIPACPHCNTAKFVVRDRMVEKLGTVLGGMTGAGGAYAGLSSGATAGALICSFIPGVGHSSGCGNGSWNRRYYRDTAGIFGRQRSAGNSIGERIDSKIHMKYRCIKCGKKIQG